MLIEKHFDTKLNHHYVCLVAKAMAGELDCNADADKWAVAQPDGSYVFPRGCGCPKNAVRLEYVGQDFCLTKLVEKEGGSKRLVTGGERKCYDNRWGRALKYQYDETTLLNFLRGVPGKIV